MNLRTVLLASTMAAGAALCGAPAFAAQTCPNIVGAGPVGGGGIGNATNCNLTITFKANGSITTAHGPYTAQPFYEGNEDALIGVVNQTNHAITSFNISATTDIFGFDGDGIDGYAGVGPVGTNPDTTGYGGPNGFFTNIVGNSGTVNFANGGIAAGGSDYFSLEEPVSIDLHVTPAPEPASMAMLGAGLVGLALLRRRRRS